MLFSHRRIALFTAACLLLLPSLSVSTPACVAARAQVITPEVIANGPRSASDEQSVRESARVNMAMLRESVAPSAGEAEAAEKFARARKNLSDPLRTVDCSPLFRTFYSGVLESDLRALARGENDRLAVAAIYVAGDLATTTGVDVLRDQAASTSLVRRYAAFAAHGRVFAALGRSQPALRESEIGELVKSLQAAIQRESDADLYDVQVRSLLDAASLSGALEPQAREAVRVLSLALAERLRALNGDPSHSEILLTNMGVLDSLRAMILNDFRRALPESVINAAVAFSGETLAYVGREVRKGDLATGPEGAAARKLAANSVRLAETIIYQAKDRYQIGQPGPAPDLGSRIEAGTRRDDQLYFDGLLNVIGPSGILRDRRFQFAAGWFSY